MPQSTVRMPIPEARIGPIVDPQPMSFRTTKFCLNNIKLSSVHRINEAKDPVPQNLEQDSSKRSF